MGQRSGTETIVALLHAFPERRTWSQVGRGRIDLCVRMPFTGPDGKREALELKVWAVGKRDPLAQGLTQLEGYLDRLGLDRGVLVIFDRRPEAGSTEDRTRFEAARTAKGYAVTVLRA